MRSSPDGDFLSALAFWARVKQFDRTRFGQQLTIKEKHYGI
jgi:hypothetical protein